MIYFTSDLHLCHDKGFLYEPRGFTNIEDHNAAIVSNFNSIIEDDDDLYILGDVFLNDSEKGIELLAQIKGRKHIIIGNHDTDAKLELLEKNRQRLKICSIDFGGRLRYKKFNFFLSHYPTLTSNFDDGDKLREHVINLSGHTHSKEKFYNKIIYNVSVDAHDMKPVSIDQVIADLKENVNV